MKIRVTALSATLFMFAGFSFGLTIEPDVVVKNISPLMEYNAPIDTVIISNTGGTDVVVDSITIQLLDGDSIDFAAGKTCEPGSASCYLYGGWMFGSSNVTLRYLRDSLFLLQNSDGNPVTITVAANSTAEFEIELFVNCPVCGRMPSFPGTVDYRYLFYTAGQSPDTLQLKINPGTVLQRNTASYPVMKRLSIAGETFTITGRKIGSAGKRYSGVVVDGKTRTVKIDAAITGLPSGGR
jgi:hypothetical protein